MLFYKMKNINANVFVLLKEVNFSKFSLMKIQKKKKKKKIEKKE